MRKLLSKIRKIERNTVIRNSFLLPILSVVIMSISHVITWYDLGNPFLWAIYLSVAVEIFALASVSAATIKMKKGSIWVLFSLVTFIQIVGNVFFTYQYIDVENVKFLSWIELIHPWFEDWSPIDHRRLLATFQGGTLPFMSLIALHFYIKFNENLNQNQIKEPSPIDPEPLADNLFSDLENLVVEKSENLDESILLEDPVVAVNSQEDEKKDTDNQIHIIDESEEDARNRRRLHPSRY